jgi:hypothetical protein
VEKGTITGEAAVLGRGFGEESVLCLIGETVANGCCGPSPASIGFGDIPGDMPEDIPV